MITVKLSYSILNAWEQKRYEDAVGMYLGKGIATTPYMELGKVKHQQWADYTMKHGTLHPELGGNDLHNPIVEQKYQKLIPFSDDIQILVRGIIDLEDGETIIDHKCGMSTPSSYIDAWQLDLYKLLRPKATLGKYLCYNPYSQSLAVGIKFLSEKNAEHAMEKIITFGGEMIDYLQASKLLIDYKEV